MHLQKPLQTKVPIDDLYREPCISPQIQLIKLQKVILVTSKENYFLNRKECLTGEIYTEGREWLSRRNLSFYLRQMCYRELINLKCEINVIKSAVKSCYDQEYFCTFVRDKINEQVLTINLMKAKKCLVRIYNQRKPVYDKYKTYLHESISCTQNPQYSL